MKEKIRSTSVTSVSGSNWSFPKILPYMGRGRNKEIMRE